MTSKVTIKCGNQQVQTITHSYNQKPLAEPRLPQSGVSKNLSIFGIQNMIQVEG